MTTPLSKLRTYNRPTNGLAWVREAERLLAEAYEREPYCWHCQVVLIDDGGMRHPHCYNCPAHNECDEEDCSEPGCLGIPPRPVDAATREDASMLDVQTKPEKPEKVTLKNVADFVDQTVAAEYCGVTCLATLKSLGFAGYELEMHTSDKPTLRMPFPSPGVTVWRWYPPPVFHPPLPRADTQSRAKPNCSNCKGTGNTIIGNELTSNVVPCHCVSVAAIAGLYVSPFGTPLELIPEGATEFVSDGFRALRFDGGLSEARITSATTWQCRYEKDEFVAVFDSGDMRGGDSVEEIFPWLRYWLPRADEPIERAAERSCSECGAQAILADTEGSERPLCCECYQPPPPAKDSLTAEAGWKTDATPERLVLIRLDLEQGGNVISACRELDRVADAWQSERAQHAEEIARLKGELREASRGAFSDITKEDFAMRWDVLMTGEDPVSKVGRRGREIFVAFGGEDSDEAWERFIQLGEALNLRTAPEATARAEKAEARARELERELAKWRDDAITLGDNARDDRKSLDETRARIISLQSEVTRLTAALNEARSSVTLDTEQWGNERTWLFDNAPQRVLEYCDYLLKGGSLPVAIPESGEETVE